MIYHLRWYDVGNRSIGGLNARGIAKYSDFGLVEGYISETVHELSIGTKIGDLEWPKRRNGTYFAFFHRIHVRCRRKTIIRPIPRFQNLLLIVYDHINTICAIIQRVFGQNKRRLLGLLQTVVAYAHVFWWVSWTSLQAHIVQYGGLDDRVHFNYGGLIKLGLVLALFHDLLLRSYLCHCVWSVITAHNLTPEKRDNNYLPHPLTRTSCLRNNIQHITGMSRWCGCL